MPALIGVVGPRDLVDTVALACRRDDARTLCFAYDAETQAPAIVEAHAAEVDGWLFTGIVPYMLAEQADVLARPAVYVRYTSEALQQMFIRLLRDGHGIDRISIDTMSHNAVTRTYARADTPTSEVRVLPYRSDLSAGDYADFHRRARRGSRGTTFAVTCLSSVYHLLGDDIPAWRLRPSRDSIRTAERQLLLSLAESRRGDAHIALGLVELPDAGRSLLHEADSVGGALAKLPDGLRLLVTTRGQLATATNEFTELAMLHRLHELHPTVWIGFGLGYTAAEAEHLARRALTRARRLGDVAGVLARRNHADQVLATGPPQQGRRPVRLEDVAQRSGVAVETLNRLRRLDGGRQHGADDSIVTTHTVADHLGLQVRSARRILQRLARAGVAERVGNQPTGSSGRPATLYRLAIPPARAANGGEDAS